MASNLFILWLLSILLPVQLTGQELYKSNSVKIGFFSSAPIEDIQAVTEKGISLWNINTQQISFLVQIETFQFRKAKMQIHFNENFMESHRFPYATFRGYCEDFPEAMSDGVYTIELEGDLEIKGVKKNRKLPARLKIENGELYLESEFEVPCKEHNIEIPRIFWKNIAEVIEVKVEAIYLKNK